MFMKLFIVACLTVAVFGRHTFNEEDRNRFKNAFRRTCVRNGAEDKAPEAEAALDTFVDCIKAQIDPDTVKSEIEAARPNGAVDEVFKKYCDKKPAFKSCMTGLFNGVYPCLSADVRGHLDSDNNATDRFLDFICHNDGERIALFIAEDGVGCFNEKEDEIIACVGNLRKNIDAEEEVRHMSIDSFCNRLTAFTSCTVSSLENCSSPTPSNMAESLFKYVKNSTPCKKFED
ncbi:27 kDa hemolymph protein [Pieris rapae]|uniref:27 kDa hemolymph protein n=1 Tax=Pieris rapae TaxID=64459 RepID=UPI001E27F5D8|nr:27 kDa hemolymph protein [Pieris rapae]